MRNIKNNFLARLVFFALAAYGIHRLVFSFLFPGVSNLFLYSIEALYVCFGISSVVIFVVLYFIRKKEINNVGFSFLILTSLKMGIAMYFMQPILQSHAAHMTIEKFNFFIVFLVFLAIETLTTIGILNKKR